MTFEFKRVGGACAVLSMVALLAACGGGGGDDEGNAGTPASSNGTFNNGSGAATPPAAPPAAFVKGTRPRVMLLSRSLQFNGSADSMTQVANGGVVSVGSYTLTTPNQAVGDVAGGTDFALGRWLLVPLDVSLSAKAHENNDHHYVVYNARTTLGTPGAYTCNAGVFTKPTHIDEPIVHFYPRTLGEATLTIGATARVSVKLTTNLDFQSTSLSTEFEVSSPNTLATTQNYYSRNSGLQVVLAEGAAAHQVRLIVGYQTRIERYGDVRGVGTFLCTLK